MERGVIFSKLLLCRMDELFLVSSRTNKRIGDHAKYNLWSTSNSAYYV